MKNSVLIICIGNDLRGDDGFAKAVGEAIIELKIANVLFVHQLLPEHAAEIVNYKLVIFVDVKYGEDIAKIELQNVNIEDAKLESFGHYQTPATILLIAQTLFGKSITAYLLTAQSLYFDKVESLSSELKSAVNKCVDKIALIVK